MMNRYQRVVTENSRLQEEIRRIKAGSTNRSNSSTVRSDEKTNESNPYTPLLDPNAIQQEP